MSTLRTDNLQTTDSTFSIPVKSLGGIGKSLLDFGASATDLDHSQAFQNAWASSGDVHIPDGTWYIKSPVGSLTVGSSVRFFGSPNAKVRLSGTGGFNVTGQGWAFDGFTITPDGVVPYAIKSGTVGDNHRWSIRNMSIYPDTALGSYFNQAVDLYAAWYGTMSENYIRNNGSINFLDTPQGGGLRLNYCVNNAFTSNTIGGCLVGCEVMATPGVNGNVCEGLLFDTNTFIANRSHVKIYDGLLINGVNNILDITLPGDYPLLLKASCCNWTNNWINVANFPALLGAGAVHGGQRNLITENSFIAAVGAVNLLTTVSGEVTAYNRLVLNQFLGGLSALGLSLGDDSWDIDDNNFVGQTSQAYDVSLGTKIRLNDNRAPAGTLRLIDVGCHIKPLTHTVSTAANFPATGVGGNFSVSIPIVNSPYNTAPDFATFVTDGAAQLIVRYLKTSSTKDTLVFSAVAVSAAIGAGSYNVYVESKSATDAY